MHNDAFDYLWQVCIDQLLRYADNLIYIMVTVRNRNAFRAHLIHHLVTNLEPVLLPDHFSALRNISRVINRC